LYKIGAISILLSTYFALPAALTCILAKLPLLLELSTDEIWGVRKACADSIVAVSKYLSDVRFLSCLFTILLLLLLLIFRDAKEQRVKELVPLMQRLVNPSNESSRWVRTSAYQALGYILLRSLFVGCEC